VGEVVREQHERVGECSAWQRRKRGRVGEREHLVEKKKKARGQKNKGTHARVKNGVMCPIDYFAASDNIWMREPSHLNPRSH
jgi:hypothetical protein